MYMRLFTTHGFLIGLILMKGAAFAAQTSNLTQTDMDFVNKLAMGNMAEVQLGKLAEQKAMSKSVKEFGKMMVEDHTKLNDQLKQWAIENGATLPSKIDAQQLSAVKRIEGQTGRALDKEYVQMMLKDHREDVREVQQTAENAKNPKVKELAVTILPVLENHLRVAENVAGKIGVSAKSGLNE